MDSTEDLIYREKMRALKRGVMSGRNTYENDLDKLSKAIRESSARSKIADTLYCRLISSLNKKSISDDFDYYISQINKHT